MPNEAPNFTFGKAVHSAGTPIEAAIAMMEGGLVALTIKQVALLTGLTTVYIRRRTQEGRWSKTYDARGRVIIPTEEILSYLEEKATRTGKAYIVRLTPSELILFQATFPDKALTSRYDPIAAKAYRLKKAANQANRGTTRGRLYLP